MGFYRLEPMAGQEAREEWQTTLCREPCYVTATSPEAARHFVAAKTHRSSRAGGRMMLSPWASPEITSCVEDRNSPHKQQLHGRVVSASGRTFAI